MDASRYVVSIFCVFFSFQPLLAQEWSIAANPWPRAGARMVYDAPNERMVMFGGGDLKFPWGDAYNDAWALNLVCGQISWQRLSPAGERPQPRQYAAAVCDSAGHRMIIFAGNTNSTEFFHDTWMLTLERGNERWEEIQATGVSPSPRSGAAAVYDYLGERMILFAGQYREQEYFNEVWSLDVDSSEWQLLTPSGTPPTPRFNPAVTYDPAQPRMIVIGGKSATELLDDVWELDLTPGSEAWNELSVSGDLPGRRANHVAICDGTTRRVYIFGGFDYPPFTYPEDIHCLDLNNLQWTRITLHPAPRGRRGLCGDFDRLSRRLIVFGGNRYYYGAGAYFADTDVFTIPSTEVTEQEEPLSSFFVANAAPNPSASSSAVLFYTPDARQLTIKVYSALGSYVETLLDDRVSPGWHSVEWDGKDERGAVVGSGQYFLHIQAGETTETRSVVVLR